MSDIDLFWLLLKIAGLLSAIGFARWWGQRKSYRSGYPIRLTPRAQPIEEPPPGRTRNPETHAEFNGVPCDPGLDYSRIGDALNAKPQDDPEQDDQHPGPSWGIIR
jgi:hypothetical protein